MILVLACQPLKQTMITRHKGKVFCALLVSCLMFYFSDGELTIKKGEMVIVLNRTNQTQWKGSVNNKVGMFPSSVLRKGLKRPSGTPSSHGDTAKKHSEVKPNTQNKKSKVQTLLSVSRNDKADDHLATQLPNVQPSGHRDPLCVSSEHGEKD